MPQFAETVARRIRELREARGFSLRELARRSGLPPESISRSERGVTEITLTNLARLCSGLGLDLSTFFQVGCELPSADLPRGNIVRIVEMLSHLREDRLREVARALDLLLRGETRSSGRRRHSPSGSGQRKSPQGRLK